jgi:toluene monooxygenase system protein E
MSEQPESAERKPLKTWTHLAGQRKRPSEYEIVSVNTLYTGDNPEAPLELSPDLPMNRWYRRYRTDSLLRHGHWDAFRDPDAVTYRAYCTNRDKDEVYVDGLLSQYHDLGHDAGLAPGWIAELGALYTPLRYLLHGAQMAHAYIVTMAPGSTIVNCAALTMADQFRWVSRVAYRTAELRKSWPDAGFGQREREHWEQAPAWQGFRELMERLLATYDWGESLIALNLAAMPAIDAVLRRLGDRAAANGDQLTVFLVQAQLKDSERRERWVNALLDFLKANPANAAVIDDILGRWSVPGARAAAAYCKT